MWNEHITKLPVQTLEKIEHYANELLRWNEKFNLVSRKNNLNDIKNHILDCMQLENHMQDKNAKIVDIGSGAGLPGIVLAILGYENCNLIETNSKKCVFLTKISSELNLPINIHNDDVAKINFSNVDFIVSRAFAAPEKLLSVSEHFISPGTKYLMYQNDLNLEVLQKEWHFELKIHDNIYKNNNSILELSSLQRH